MTTLWLEILDHALLDLFFAAKIAPNAVKKMPNSNAKPFNTALMVKDGGTEKWIECGAIRQKGK